MAPVDPIYLGDWSAKDPIAPPHLQKHNRHFNKKTGMVGNADICFLEHLNVLAFFPWKGAHRWRNPVSTVCIPVFSSVLNMPTYIKLWVVPEPANLDQNLQKPDSLGVKKPKPKTAKVNKSLQFSSVIFDHFQHLPFE